MRATLKILFWHFFEKKNKKAFQKLKNFTFVSNTLSFRKFFLNENIFVSKNFYFRFGKTFTFFKLKYFRLKNKNVSKTTARF